MKPSLYGCTDVFTGDWEAVICIDEANEDAWNLLNRNDARNVTAPLVSNRPQPPVEHVEPPIQNLRWELASSPTESLPLVSIATEVHTVYPRLSRIRVFTKTGDLVGYLDSHGEWGPVHEAHYFWIPRADDSGKFEIYVVMYIFLPIKPCSHACKIG